jgi:signal transduction histidine kinase
MVALRDMVLDEWVTRLRATVKEAEKLPHPILINTFPGLYDNIAQAITPGYPRKTAEDGNTVALEHGGERARLTSYNAQGVVTEYQLLRWTIFEVLKANGVHFTNEEFTAINLSIDNCIRDSVEAFALTQAALRERFVAALTHDLRNPLASASSAADLIKLTGESERTRGLAERITTNLARMDGMIQNLLDAMVFHTGERLRLKIEHFDVHELAREMCDQFTAVHGHRFELRGKTVEGYWDREALKRVIENLLGNAVKYGDPDTVIRVAINSAHERMFVSVHNKGTSIPADQLESIFEVFRRSTAAKTGEKQGWGIGLPYVRSVAESHGGSVAVDSSKERGTTFTIDIPVDSRPYQHAPILDG